MKWKLGNVLASSDDLMFCLLNKEGIKWLAHKGIK